MIVRGFLKPLLVLAALALALPMASLRSASADDYGPVDYDTQIKPLLASRCYACHGPDEKARQADLRLDDREAAVDYAIEPGDAENSYLIERIAAEDPDERMPPPDSKKKPLTAAEIDLVRRWIDQGAKFEAHWAYVPPTRPDVPEVDNKDWPLGPIDQFIAAKHKEQGLTPAPEADPRTLIRRLSFDLIGLPPTPEEVDAFLADKSPDAYEKVVDRLLASPHFGERMAVYWLDVVRYADTGGYHSDNHRDVWLFRDWVIQSFNENKPYDQFVVEQLAGDLLPDATREQRIASGYNRLLQTTEEGGAQPKEYQAKYDADRVRNTAEAFIASTMGCCQCHDHKFDPFTQKDFYSFASFFADIKERSVGRQEQTPLPTDEQAAEMAKLDGQIAELKKVLDAPTPELQAAQAGWEKSLETRAVEWTPLVPTEAKSTGGATLTVAADGTITASGQSPDKDTYTLSAKLDRDGVTGLRLEVLADPSLPAKGPGRAANGNFVLNEITATADGKPVEFAAVTATHSQDNYPVANAADGNAGTGWAILPQVGTDNHAVLETKADLAAGAALAVTLRFEYGSSHTIGKLRLATTTAVRPVRAGGNGGLPKNVTDALAVAPDKRNDKQKQELATFYRGIAPELAPTREKIAALENRKKQLQGQVPTSLVSMSVNPRTIRVLPRGNWLDDSGEVVGPAVPAFLGNVGTGDQRPTRLDLARWVVSDENPLAARVMVNRLWKLTFGEGLVRSLDDFGTQGDPPTHRKLLDWLAVEFRSSGWDVKHMLKLMVTSRTYRQSSRASEELRRVDPTNRWLARQGRFRLPAEMVRDNALATSGLLSDEIGGPSVKPYQPAGYWQHLNFPRRTYVPDKGENQYRRGLYTYWQRSFLHPSLLAFDASSREECTVARPRSNTPLQALVLLNDPTYVETARVLAARTIREAGSAEPERVRYVFRAVLQRDPGPRELDVLTALLHKHHEEYAADEAAAKALVAEGDSEVPRDIPPADLAAWTSVARVVLNLHETITRY